MSLKETSPVFFRVRLLVLGQVSFSGFAERVFSTCKLVLALNRKIIVGDFETFNNLVILRHNKEFLQPTSQNRVNFGNVAASIARDEGGG